MDRPANFACWKPPNGCAIMGCTLTQATFRILGPLEVQERLVERAESVVAERVGASHRRDRTPGYLGVARVVSVGSLIVR